MNLFFQILGLTLNLVLMFFLIRGVIKLYIDSVLDKRTRKSLAKNPSFDEWFFYKRYTAVLPKYFMWWYFANMALYILFVIIVVISYFLRMHHIGPDIIKIYFMGDATLLIAFRYAFINKIK